MKPALALASILGNPLAPGDENGPALPVGVDDAVEVRAFHADAFVVVGGDLDLQVVPVQDREQRPFLVTDAVPSPDAALNLGAGWLMVRDARGNGTVVLVDNDMSLRDLQAALEADDRLQVGTAIAFDSTGARLVVVLDTAGRDAFEAERLEFRPAASIATGARAGFVETAAVVLPTRSFDGLDGGRWPVDGTAVWSSSRGDGLWLAEVERDTLMATDLPTDTSGWEPFAELARPVPTPDGWVLEPVPGGDEIRNALSYDNIRAWSQRRATWVVTPDGETDWVPAQGTLSMVEEMGIDPADYGITPVDRD